MRIRVLSLLFLSLFAASCSTESTRGAAEGATAGAVTGAIGGMVTALVFGGDVGDAAARGAVWGGSTGAVAGGVRGAEQGNRMREAEKQQQTQSLESLRSKIGDDAFRGLEALAQCKHKVAIAYAESAQQDSNRDYALAGYWLEIMAVAEDAGEDAAVVMLPELVQRDPKLTSTSQARTLVGEVMDDLEKVRVDNGMAGKCA